MDISEYLKSLKNLKKSQEIIQNFISKLKIVLNVWSKNSLQNFEKNIIARNCSKFMKLCYYY